MAQEQRGQIVIKVKVPIGLVYDFSDVEVLKGCIVARKVGCEGDMASLNGGGTWRPFSELMVFLADS